MNAERAFETTRAVTYAGLFKKYGVVVDANQRRSVNKKTNQIDGELAMVGKKRPEPFNS
jgi:hypothetical protein